jgi:hypothetical protein
MDRPRTVPYARTFALAGLLLFAGAVACDDETTGTADARVTAEVHDENPDAQTASLASLLPLQQSSNYEGTVSGEARVEVSADGETWTELGDASDVDVDLQASGGGAVVHADAAVPLDSFTWARLVLDGADAVLEAGSTVSGVTLESETTVALGTGQVIVEAQLDESLDAGAGTDATVSFDLNSEAWITETAVEAGAVAESAISSAATVQVTRS